MVRDVTREVSVTQAVTVLVTESGRAAGLTLEDVLAHINEDAGFDDIRRDTTILATVSFDEDTVDESDNDATQWETESIAYIDSEPGTISGTGLDDDELFRLACRRYVLACDRRGEVPQQPCLYRSFMSENQIILANVNGELARYAVRNGGLAKK